MGTISIRPISIHDTSKIVEWRNEESVRNRLFNKEVITEEQHLNWIENYVFKKKAYQFIIEVHNKDSVKAEAIGTTFIKNIDMSLLSAEFGFFIGSSLYRGRGYGVIAANYTLDFGFEELLLNSIYSNVYSDNTPSIGALQKTGMKLIEENVGDEFGECSKICLLNINREEWSTGNGI